MIGPTIKGTIQILNASHMFTYIWLLCFVDLDAKVETIQFSLVKKCFQYWQKSSL